MRLSENRRSRDVAREQKVVVEFACGVAHLLKGMQQHVVPERIMAYGRMMKSVFAFAVLLALAVPAAAQQAYCPYGQTCQNTNPVPFPVINPLAGLNVLNPGKLLAPPQQQPDQIYRPTTPTPPPVLPPER